MMVIFAKEERAGAVEKVRALRGRVRGARRRRNEDMVVFGRLNLLGGGLSNVGWFGSDLGCAEACQCCCRLGRELIDRVRDLSRRGRGRKTSETDHVKRIKIFRSLDESRVILCQ